MGSGLTSGGERTCEACGEDLPARAAFCVWCGVRQVSAPPEEPPVGSGMARCEACLRLVPRHARYCTGCGASMPTAGLGPPSTSGPEDERRTVTVLQGDVVGFTRLAESLSPEEVKELIDALYTRLTREVVAQGGQVDKFIGDAVLAVFGVPIAHGDDPRRAVEAGLALHRCLDEVGRRLLRERGLSLRMRVGIETGSVVVGQMAGARRSTVTGPALASAMELEAAAPAGGVLVGEGTYRQIRDHYQVRLYTEAVLERKAWLVEGRQVAGGPVGEPPLVGRELELAQLSSLVERAIEAGWPLVVTLTGATGVGKSRLVRELVSALGARLSPPPLVLAAASVEAGGPGGADLVVQWLRSLMGDNTSLGTTREDVAQLVAGALATGEGARGDGAPEGAEIVELVAHLMDLGGTSVSLSRSLLRDPVHLRRRMARALGALLGGLSRHAPLLLVAEDHQWCRPSSERLVLAALQEAGPAPILLLRVMRSEGAGDALPTQPEHHEIRLAPLGKQATFALSLALTSGREGMDELAPLLAGLSDGNPLVLMELVRGLSSRDGLRSLVAADAEVGAGGILHQVVQARLDRLTVAERRLLQSASVAGMVFWEDLLRRMGAADAAEVLERLTEGGWVKRLRTSAFPGTHAYTFTHAAIHEVAYGGVLLRVRRFLHRVTAAWLEEQLGDRTEELAEALAWHHLEGGEPLLAARYFLRAAARARRLDASQEASSAWQQALDVLDGVVGVDATRLRIQALEGLGELALAQGDPPRAHEALRGALELARALGEPADLALRARLELRQGEVFSREGRPEQALACFDAAASRLVGIASPDASERTLRAEVAKARGWTLSRAGRRDEAEATFTAGLAGLTEATEEERLVTARLWSALGLLQRLDGRPAEAMASHKLALAAARRTADPELRCVCLVNRAAVLVDLRHLAEAVAHYEEALATQERLGREEDAAISRVNLAAVALEMGDDALAARWAAAARAQLEARETHWALPELYRILAQLALRAGDDAEARTLAMMAVSMGERVGRPYYVGEAMALLGVLAERAGDLEEALAHLNDAQRRLEEVGEPRQLARVLLERARLRLARGAVADDALRADLATAARLLAPYPEDPARRLLSSLQAGGEP